MKRYQVTERGQPALPPLDLDGDVVIGSGGGARLRLPGAAAEEAHVRIAGDSWVAIAEVGLVADGAVRRCAPGEGGPIDDGIELELGNYRVRIEPAPSDAVAASPVRTASLARELVRNLLGGAAAPVVELVKGPGAPSRRDLPAPGSRPTIVGRGDGATWRILDGDLSREHVELVRDWDGVSIRDLGSKNGTRVDGVLVDGATLLSDGARIEAGNIELVFRDPAEQHLRGDAVTPEARSKPALPRPRPRPPEPTLEVPGSPFGAVRMVAAAIAVLAVVGLIWIALS